MANGEISRGAMVLLVLLVLVAGLIGLALPAVAQHDPQRQEGHQGGDGGYTGVPVSTFHPASLALLGLGLAGLAYLRARWGSRTHK